MNLEKGINIVHKTSVNFNFSEYDIEILNLYSYYQNNLQKYDEDIFENNSEFIKKELIKEIKSFIKNKSKFIIIFSNLDEYIDIFNDPIFNSIIECFSNYYLIINVKNIFKLNKNIIRNSDNFIVGKLPVNTKRYLKRIVKKN